MTTRARPRATRNRRATVLASHWRESRVGSMPVREATRASVRMPVYYTAVRGSVHSPPRPTPQLSLGEVLLVDRARHRVLRVHDVGDLDHSALAQELVGVHFIVSVVFG